MALQTTPPATSRPRSHLRGGLWTTASTPSRPRLRSPSGGPNRGGPGWIVGGGYRSCGCRSCGCRSCRGLWGGWSGRLTGWRRRWPGRFGRRWPSPRSAWPGRGSPLGWSRPRWPPPGPTTPGSGGPGGGSGSMWGWPDRWPAGTGRARTGPAGWPRPAPAGPAGRLTPGLPGTAPGTVGWTCGPGNRRERPWTRRWPGPGNRWIRCGRRGSGGCWSRWWGGSRTRCWCPTWGGGRCRG
jgi:hypothetical protein